MIHFFRKIRYQLMEKNNTLKYLKYAIGEIVLVVIGILIALQINSWNQGRKESLLKETYINRLIIDVKKDTTQLHSIHKRLSNGQIIIARYIEALTAITPPLQKLTAIENFFSEGWFTPDFSSQNNTFQDLSQTGNMTLFKDTRIAERILAYYAFIEELGSGHAINKQWVLPIDVVVTERTPALQFSAPTRQFFKDRENEKTIIELLQHTPLLERNAATHFWVNKEFMQDLNRIEVEAISLLTALQQEIKN